MGIVTNSTDKFQKCIDECNKCAQACYECFKACLNEPDVNARKNCIGILAECAQMCQMSSSMMSMDGEFTKEHCQLCATICDKCAQECEMFKDDHCQKCAQECHICANECRNMAGM
ncbi:four-helix bundle copper-binding protein [Clostridium sporogenes]|uniref:four-helix bundle copper-binding protein n=1 Tax=Clostridium TaxID=1485 RepID=UPI00223878AF|nr:four-helix bundle copper-binding protein [Clostridium sporogenes]MCW6076570.1 four-helix bundle copper-binding protein [Clostridium sporogenes]